MSFKIFLRTSVSFCNFIRSSPCFFKRSSSTSGVCCSSSSSSSSSSLSDCSVFFWNAFVPLCSILLLPLLWPWPRAWPCASTAQGRLHHHLTHLFLILRLLDLLLAVAFVKSPLFVVICASPANIAIVPCVVLCPLLIQDFFVGH